MLAPSFVTHADLHRHHVVVAVSGPFTAAEHGDALRAAGLPLPTGYGLLVDLSGVTVIADPGVRALKDLARSTLSAGHSVAFVCSELLLRAELILADLDVVAPVLQALEQAYPLVGFAA